MNIISNIVNLFYPEVCVCCKEQLTTFEKTICLHCRHELPLTNFSFEKENLVEKAFYGRVPLESATALFYFLKKGKVQQLIHELKYKNHQEVGKFIGNWLGEEMAESARFTTIDCIIPVPLHPKKLKSRGYNQVTTFGQSLAKKLKIPYVEDVLIRKSATKTQTKKLRFDRWKNVEELFFAEKNPSLNKKHILLIDDVITTGATLEACYKALSKNNSIKLSIACMAYTK